MKKYVKSGFLGILVFTMVLSVCLSFLNLSVAGASLSDVWSGDTTEWTLNSDNSITTNATGGSNEFSLSLKDSTLTSGDYTFEVDIKNAGAIAQDLDTIGFALKGTDTNPWGSAARIHMNYYAIMLNDLGAAHFNGAAYTQNKAPGSTNKFKIVVAGNNIKGTVNNVSFLDYTFPNFTSTAGNIALFYDMKDNGGQGQVTFGNMKLTKGTDVYKGALFTKEVASTSSSVIVPEKSWIANADGSFSTNPNAIEKNFYKLTLQDNSLTSGDFKLSYEVNYPITSEDNGTNIGFGFKGSAADPYYAVRTYLNYWGLITWDKTGIITADAKKSLIKNSQTDFNKVDIEVTGTNIKIMFNGQETYNGAFQKYAGTSAFFLVDKRPVDVNKSITFKNIKFYNASGNLVDLEYLLEDGTVFEDVDMPLTGTSSSSSSANTSNNPKTSDNSVFIIFIICASMIAFITVLRKNKNLKAGE